MSHSLHNEIHHSLHNEIHRITDTDEHGILKSSMMSCPGCSSAMNLVPCSSKKSSDLLIWRCSPCSRHRNICTDSERKLCPTHLVGDSTVPPPLTHDPDSPSDVDLDLSVHTEQILERIENGDDPLNLLPRDSIPPTPSSPTVDTPLNLSEIPPPPPEGTSAAGPVRRRKTTRQGSAETAIHETYPLVLEMVKGGTSARQAIQHIQMPRSTFYKWRFVAEMKLVDSSHFQHLAGQFKGSKLYDVCKDTLMDSDPKFGDEGQL